MPTVLQQHHSDTTMTTVDIPEKQHRKLKKEAVKRKIDLKDLVAEKLGGLIIMVILFVSGLGIAAYAEEVNLPLEEPYDDTFCSFLKEGNHVTFSCNWRWFLPDYVLQGIENDTTVPGVIEELPQHNLDLADKIRELLAIPPPVEEPEELDPDAERRADIAERIAEQDAEKIQLLGKLAECRTGLGAFAAYQEQAAIEDYTNQTRWQFAERDNLSSNITVLKILKAIEECDIMKEYVRLHLISEYELNRYLADQAGLDYLGRPQEHPLNPDVTDQDQNAMVATDPVTPKDIADEIEDMEKIFDETYRDPNEDFSGINRGGQPAGLKCQIHGQPAPIGAHAPDVCPLSRYDAHILKNWDSITYKDILQLQCDNFLYIYQHKIGTHEFPAWLNHCVPKVVRNG